MYGFSDAVRGTAGIGFIAVLPDHRDRLIELIEGRPGPEATHSSTHGNVETLVLGQIAVADGELTENQPGGLVRGRWPIPTRRALMNRLRHAGDAL